MYRMRNNLRIFLVVASGLLLLTEGNILWFVHYSSYEGISLITVVDDLD